MIHDNKNVKRKSLFKEAMEPLREICRFKESNVPITSINEFNQNTKFTNIGEKLQKYSLSLKESKLTKPKKLLIAGS